MEQKQTQPRRECSLNVKLKQLLMLITAGLHRSRIYYYSIAYLPVYERGLVTSCDNTYVHKLCKHLMFIILMRLSSALASVLRQDMGMSCYNNCNSVTVVLFGLKPLLSAPKSNIGA